ncbi:MAG: tRNA (adenosine(37)-N6)-threonylcarbamoyltransferase complex dimerization subunit type 1 TsaB [Planctomycetota bacterium]|jgi:tRNA threonylcarbamoyladenosine biosynthesis protein TsaB
MAESPLILAVETSGRIGSVALAVGEKLLGQREFSGAMRHSSEIFPAICALLEDLHRKPPDIEHVYVSVGPGSFTGLRIAVALAKTMHLANKTKIVAVDTMDVIASNASDYLRQKDADIHRIATILDAKRSQFFVAAYELRSSKNNNTRYERILPDCLMTAPQFLEEFAGNTEPIWLLGEGLLYHKDAFKCEGVDFLPEDYWSPHASKVHQLGRQMSLKGEFTDPLTLQPLYLRRPEAEEKWKQRNVP